MRVVIYALVLGLMTMVASAATVAFPYIGLVIAPDGSATITNTSPISLVFDAYEVVSAGGNLNSTTWMSIADMLVSDPGAVSAGLSGGANGFTELTASTYSISEATLFSGAVLDAGASWSIGVVLDAPSVSDLTFYWHGPINAVGDQYEGPVTLSALPGDTDLDGDVDLTDFNTLKSNFESGLGKAWAQGDFDGDGEIKLSDFNLLKNNFTGGTSVPEPASATLALLGAAGMALKRRRK